MATAPSTVTGATYVDITEHPRVLFVHNRLTTFVRIDRDLLRARYDVEELAITGRWAAPWRVWSAVRRCDTVFCWFASAHSLLPALCGRLQGRPVVMVIGGYDTANVPEIAYGHQRGGLKKHVARTAMALASRLITNSHFTHAEAVREAGVHPGKIVVVYHGIAAPASDSWHELGGRSVRDVILTVGGVDRPNLRRKGLEAFVRAAALLPERRFVLVGAWLDDAIDDLRALASPNVTFTGRVSDADLDGYFRRAAVYVQASAHEGFGVALAQAMVAGCVPVVTRAGALPEVVGEAGIYAASADPADLAAAIRRALAAGPELRVAARSRVAVCFSLPRRAGGLAAVVDAALSAGNRGAHRTESGHAAARRASDTTQAPASVEPELALPVVSVVMPTRNEEKDIAACLGAVLAQDYPPERMEVLVIDGRSSDRTRAIVEQLAAADPWSRVRLLDNPRVIVSPALNAGIRAARGDVIARVDGHTIIAPDYLRRCAETLMATGADNVGGLMRPRGHGYAGHCIALATRSRFGIGDSRFHYDERGGDAETVYLGCFRRAAFERVGLFDEALARNQDDELNDRITAAGGRIWLNPAIRSTYVNRGSFRALWRQYYQYGFWKVPVLRRHAHARRPRHLAPAALVIVLSVSAVLNAMPALAGEWLDVPRWLRVALRAPAIATWGGYGCASLAASVVCAARSRWRYLPGLLWSFWCLHLSYGAGFLAGVLSMRRRASASHAVTRIPRLEPRDQAPAARDAGAP